MKIFLIALLLVVAVVAQKDGKGDEGKHEKGEHGKGDHGKGGHGKGDHGIEKIPGCENADSVKNIKASSCCPALPKLFEKNVWKNCSKTCEKSDNEFCCKSDCYLTSYKLVDSTGKFDANAAKTIIKNAVNNDTTWPVDSIVDDCIAGAPAKLAEMEAKMAAKAAENTKKAGKALKPCANPLNFIIGQCIRRGLIIQCPGWVQNATCSSLMTFAKSCPMYPFRGCDGKGGEKGEKGEKDVEKKGKGGRKTREVEADTAADKAETKEDKKADKAAAKAEKKAERDAKKEEKKKEREEKKAEKKAAKEEKKKEREAMKSTKQPGA